MEDQVKDEMPLRCEIKDGAIDMGVGLNVLAFAAWNHPGFWDGESGTDVPNIKVIDLDRFAKEVMVEINREREDGSTLLTDMLDKAIEQAVGNGSEAVDYGA